MNKHSSLSIGEIAPTENLQEVWAFLGLEEFTAITANSEALKQKGHFGLISHISGDRNSVLIETEIGRFRFSAPDTPALPGLGNAGREKLDIARDSIQAAAEMGDFISFLTTVVCQAQKILSDASQTGEETDRQLMLMQWHATSIQKQHGTKLSSLHSETSQEETGAQTKSGTPLDKTCSMVNRPDLTALAPFSPSPMVRRLQPVSLDRTAFPAWTVSDRFSANKHVTDQPPHKFRAG